MFILGLRKVYPYYFTFTTFTKVINEKLKTNEITFLSPGQKKLKRFESSKLLLTMHCVPRKGFGNFGTAVFVYSGVDR